MGCQSDGIMVRFAVTDTVQRVRVTYRGLLPDLFKEGKGVVAEEVLAKHDENYMPPDAAYAVKKAQEAIALLKEQK